MSRVLPPPRHWNLKPKWFKLLCDNFILLEVTNFLIKRNNLLPKTSDRETEREIEWKSLKQDIYFGRFIFIYLNFFLFLLSYPIRFLSMIFFLMFIFLFLFSGTYDNVCIFLLVKRLTTCFWVVFMMARSIWDKVRWLYAVEIRYVFFCFFDQLIGIRRLN